MSSILPTPRTVEEIFQDYRGRRSSIVRALTHDVDEFFGMCDPEGSNLCLYGHPNKSWEVNLPEAELPPKLPEPAPGINFSRDAMNRKDWLTQVAIHSDYWLLAVAFYLGARLNQNERKRLFSLINDLPTVFDAVTKERHVENKPTADGRSKSKISFDEHVKSILKVAEGSFKEDDDVNEDTQCGSCGGNYSDEEFWIACDFCERWYHGNCVQITPAKSENMEQYKCSYCSLKQAIP